MKVRIHKVKYSNKNRSNASKQVIKKVKIGKTKARWSASMVIIVWKIRMRRESFRGE